MSTKRSRVARSSSSGEFGLLNPMETPPVNLWVKKRATVVAPLPVNHPKPAPKKDNSKVRVTVPPEQPRRNIFTLGSPVRAENDDDGSKKRVDERYRVFFQTCFYCKTKIAEKKDVFMYGYLQAFCSPECRDIQIALDGKNEKFSSEPTVAAIKVTKEEMGKRVFSSQVNKHTIAKFK